MQRDAIEEYLHQLALNRNEGYRQEIMAKEMARHADTIYGQPARPGPLVRGGFPMRNPDAMIPGKTIPGTGLYSKEGTPEERYLQAQQRMAKTGIAGFLDERQALLKSMQESIMRGDNASPGEGKMSASKRIALELGLVEGTPEYYDFIRQHSAKSGGTTVNVGGEDPYGKLPAGYQWVDFRDPSKGARPIPGTPEDFAGGTESKDSSRSVVQISNLDRLEDLVTKNPTANAFGFPGMVEGMRGKANVVGAGLDWLAASMDIPSDPVTTEMKSLTASAFNDFAQARSGASIAGTEMQRMEGELPVIGQSKELFLSNLRNTRENIKILEASKAKASGKKDIVNKPSTKLTLEQIKAIESKYPGLKYVEE